MQLTNPAAQAGATSPVHQIASTAATQAGNIVMVT